MDSFEQMVGRTKRRTGVGMLQMYQGEDLDRVAWAHYGLRRRTSWFRRESDNALRLRCNEAMRAIVGVRRTALVRAPWWFVATCWALLLAAGGLLVLMGVASGWWP